MGLSDRAKLKCAGGASKFYPVDISYSCRFDKTRSTYLYRTFSTPTDSNTWSFSCWIKLPVITTDYTPIFTNNAGSVNGFFLYGSAFWHVVNGSWVSASSYVNRDPSNWGHFFAKASGGTTYYYWNNQLIHSVASVNNVNASGTVYIGAYPASYYADLYLADMHFVDGTALAPTDFGRYSSSNTNVWVPKTASSITYGNNGFHLNFSNASSLGTDTSGIGNNFTNSALTTSDQRSDTPTSNKVTLGCIIPNALTSIYAPKNGAINVAYSGAGTGSARCAEPLPATKVYWEVDVTANSNGNVYSGVVDGTMGLTSNAPGWTSNSVGFAHDAGQGYKFVGGSSSSYGAAGATQTLGFAYDGTTGNIWLRCNGTWYGDPVAGTSPMSTVSTSVPIYAAIGHVSGSAQTTAATLNFGSTTFAYAAPTGYTALSAVYNSEPRPAITTSGTFTGNAATDGPFVYIGGVPETLTINGNTVTFKTHADKLANGFKLRTSSASYNAAGSNTWVATIPSDMRYPLNNAQVN